MSMILFSTIHMVCTHGGVQENLQYYFPQGLVKVKDIVGIADKIIEWTNRHPTIPTIQATLAQSQAQHLTFYTKTINHFKALANNTQ